MADDRRIITGTYIVPKEGNDREESVGTKWIVDTAVNKTFGGKSQVTDINATQWHNDWTSMDHPSQTPTTTITITPTVQSVYQLNDDTSTVKFFYIKNLGNVDNDDVSITISLDSPGDWDSYSSTDSSDEEWQLTTAEWQAASSNWETYSDDTTTDFDGTTRVGSYLNSDITAVEDIVLV